MIGTFDKEYRFLSNFYPIVVYHEGIYYPSVEHAYQASKTLDRNLRQWIASLKGANAAKREGKKLDLRPDWEQVKIDIMEKLLRLKFDEPKLKVKLLDTYPQELVEGNYWNDTFWGVCRGKGQNMLGKLLMKVRESFIGYE